jgi:isoquinoline 1-oxidoreductase subunit alpha
MHQYRPRVNGRRVEVRAAPDTPLLWVLRDNLGLTGTKFGCGVAQCGACVVHVRGASVPSCVVPISALGDAPVETIEGIRDPVARRVQDAWVALDVPQCGYCQSGMVMAAVALLREHERPSDRQIDDALAMHICRCGTYARIKQAVKQAAAAR